MTRSLWEMSALLICISNENVNFLGWWRTSIIESLKAFIHLFIQQALTECPPLCGDRKGKHSSCASPYSQYCASTSLLRPGSWFSTLQAIPQHNLDVLQFSSIYLKSLPGDSVWSHRVRVNPTRLTPPTSDANQTSRLFISCASY